MRLEIFWKIVLKSLIKRLSYKTLKIPGHIGGFLGGFVIAYVVLDKYKENWGRHLSRQKGEYTNIGESDVRHCSCIFQNPYVLKLLKGQDKQFQKKNLGNFRKNLENFRNKSINF